MTRGHGVDNSKNGESCGRN